MAYLKCLRNVSASSRPDGKTVTPTDDISIWLACGGRSEAYTTLAEILNDAVCLAALISDSNAVDYLVRSTTWASDMCGDSGAMTAIGGNNYAANTLLADSTWLGAIWASAYKESVFNVKVPVMTSDNTPSGVCASSRALANYETYKAFDGDDSSMWASGSADPANRWISYTFPNKVIIYGVEILPLLSSGNVYLKDFDIVDDDNNVILSDTVPNTQGWYRKLFTSPAESAKFQINTTSVNYAGNYDMEINTVQFYGRADI